MDFPPLGFRASRLTGAALLTVCALLRPASACAQVLRATTVCVLKDGVGESPGGRVCQAADGSFYGVATGTELGGDYGTVFRFTSGGKPVVVCRFTGPNGAQPAGGLIQGADGAFYGTTSAGGDTFNATDPGAGTIFRVTAAGALTTLHSFARTDGASPAGPLVQAADGTLFGTTARGGDFNGGTVFKLTPAGVFSSLRSFGGGDQLALQSGLALGADGQLYGTTSASALGYGVVGRLFRFDPAGNLTVLREFQSADGMLPVGAPTRAADGNVYGVLEGVNQSDAAPASSALGGIVYEVLPAGNTPTVYEISWEHRAVSGLVAAPDGGLYGCLDDGVTDAAGDGRQLYRFVPDGTLQNDARDFGATMPLGTATGNGATVPGEFCVASDGNVYGVFPAVFSNPKHYGGVLRVPGPGALPTVYAAGTSISLPTAGTGHFLLTLDRPAPADLLVAYELRGSARPGVDYRTLKGRARIRAGATRKIIPVTALGDLGGLFDRVLSLKLLPGAGYQQGSFGKANLWIYDDANLPPGGGDSGGTISF